MACTGATTGVCTRTINGDPFGYGAAGLLAPLNLTVLGGSSNLTLSWDTAIAESVRILIQNATRTYKEEFRVDRIDGSLVVSGLQPESYYTVSARPEDWSGSQNPYEFGDWETIKALVYPGWVEGMKFIVSDGIQVTFDGKTLVIV